jgi:hypothetical protein
MPCYRCGKVQTDPGKGEAPWGRGVLRGRQVLICPACQAAEPQWMDALDRCVNCGSTRLSIVMGSAVCRQCGFDRAMDR